MGHPSRGLTSRSPDNPKHAFRFLFRQEYGAPKLHYPVFASQNGVTSFDGYDLRTFQNYSWSFGGDPSGVFIRDVTGNTDMQTKGAQQKYKGKAQGAVGAVKDKAKDVRQKVT